MDTLDYTDVHYDRKTLNLQRRYDDQYDIMVSIESRIDELETEIRDIHQEQTSRRLLGEEYRVQFSCTSEWCAS